MSRARSRVYGGTRSVVSCSSPFVLAAWLAIPPGLFAEVDEVIKREPVVVTGSLIPTTELVGATPVDIYTSVDIAKFGSQTVRQFLSTHPSAIGSGNFGESRGNGGDGSAAVSIRGIQGGTLVLINGRRLANPDLNIIPFGAIERIEILKDGASALYGADAQAGVVNIITRKDFTGTEMYAYYGNTTDTDVGQQNYYFVTGVAGEKSSVMVGGGYYEANALFSKDRSRSFGAGTSGSSNPGRMRASGDNPGFTDIRTNLYRTFTIEPDSTILTNPPVGLVFGVAPRGAPGGPAIGDAPSLPFNPAEFHPFINLPPPDGDRFDFPRFTPAIRPSERWNIFGEGTHDLMGEHLQFFTEGVYSRSESFNQLAPTPGFGLFVPASNPYNPFGVDIDNMNYRFLEAGPRTEDVTADFFRFVAGFKGKIADTTWYWETAVLYSEDDRLYRLGGDISASALEAALNDTTAAAFNPFGYAANSPAQVARIVQTLFQSEKSTLASIDAKVGGDLLELPGGAVQTVIGGGHAEQRFNFEVDNATRTGDTVGFNQANPFSGRREYDFVFGELRIPITEKDMNAPLLHAFEVSLAGRIDEYSDFGSTENPKVTFKWQPFEEPVILRGSYGTSFIPPSFGALNFVGQSFPELLNPFTGAFEQPTGGITILGNPDLNPEEGETFTLGAVWSPPGIKGLTVSVDYYKIEIRDRIAQNTQFIIDENFRTGVAATGHTAPFTPAEARAIVDAGRFGPFDPDPNMRLINFDENFFEYLNIDSPFFNLGSVKTDGLDVMVSYEMPTDNIGTFTFTVNGTYVLSFDRQTLPGEPFDDVLGDFIPEEADAFGFGTIPRLRGNLSCFWNYKQFEFGVTANYTHGVRDYALAFDPGQNRDISSIVTVDLQASYNFPYDTRVTVGVLNVADEPPPLAVGAFADNYDRDMHDLRQRFVYGSVTKSF